MDPWPVGVVLFLYLQRHFSHSAETSYSHEYDPACIVINCGSVRLNWDFALWFDKIIQQWVCLDSIGRASGLMQAETYGTFIPCVPVHVMNRKGPHWYPSLCTMIKIHVHVHHCLYPIPSTIKVELDPKTAKLNWCSCLEPFPVLDNIPKCTNSQSTRLLTTSTYIQ